MHIAPQPRWGLFNHDPLRTRKLLAHRREIDKLRGQLDQKGLALIPLNIHLKGSWIKITIGLGKGRKLHDKRAAEKEKAIEEGVKRRWPASDSLHRIELHRIGIQALRVISWLRLLNGHRRRVGATGQGQHSGGDAVVDHQHLHG